MKFFLTFQSYSSSMQQGVYHKFEPSSRTVPFCSVTHKIKLIVLVEKVGEPLEKANWSRVLAYLEENNLVGLD